MNSKLVLTTTAVVIGIFGVGWLIAPNAMGDYWRMAPGDNLNYMGHRYAAFMIGLVVALWLARNAPNTQARRALMIGALVALALTTAISLYGALVLALNAWPAVVVELALVMGFVWVLFIRPEPLV
jgi:peptidoglycan/LPS O-acetylase OafA/YrhL